MKLDDTARMVRTLRGAPLLPDGIGEKTAVDRPMIERLVPHRDPFLLIDSIDRVDLARPAAEGTRHVDPADPVFAGHFPGDPVYPGVLQIEMVGQLALCLASLLSADTLDPHQVPNPARIRASRVRQSVFYSGVGPGAALRLQAALLDRDDMVATAAGQIFADGMLCSISVLDVCFTD